MTFASGIYSGIVRHRRFQPFFHEFQYPIFMMYLDLAELSELFQDQWLWSVETWNIAYFKRQDYWGNPEIPLDESIRDLVKERTGFRPRGPIRLLTHLRYFGYCFNPASFYYCFSPSGKKIEAIVVEVTNTPWSERHCYVLPHQENLGTENRMQFKQEKKFHVSPFLPMNLYYQWKLNKPGKNLNIHIDDFKKNRKVFDATLTLKHQALNSRNLNKVLVNYPLMTVKVMVSIHYQALLLWLKGARIFPHPKDIKGQHANGP